MSLWRSEHFSEAFGETFLVFFASYCLLPGGSNQPASLWGDARWRFFCDDRQNMTCFQPSGWGKITYESDTSEFVPIIVERQRSLVGYRRIRQRQSVLDWVAPPILPGDLNLPCRRVLRGAILLSSTDMFLQEPITKLAFPPAHYWLV